MESGFIFRSKEHRGCCIRAASFAAGPKTWVPDACVWLETEAGSIKIWVRSFANYFQNEKLTFRNKLEADNWAFSAARVIIDRALPEFDAISLPGVPRCTGSVLSLLSRPLAVLRRIGARAGTG